MFRYVLPALLILTTTHAAAESPAAAYDRAMEATEIAITCLENAIEAVDDGVRPVSEIAAVVMARCNSKIDRAATKRAQVFGYEAGEIAEASAKVRESLDDEVTARLKHRRASAPTGATAVKSTAGERTAAITCMNNAVDRYDDGVRDASEVAAVAAIRCNNKVRSADEGQMLDYALNRIKNRRRATAAGSNP
jgi:hypothetical protein